jgi:hypothetical protein
MRKHGALGFNGISVVRIKLLPPVTNRGLIRLSMAQPGGVNAIARPEYVAARNTLMRLDQIESVFPNDPSYGIGKATISIDAAKRQLHISRVDDFYMAVACCWSAPLPRTRKQRDIYATLLTQGC